MKRLILMRHAKSSWGQPGLDDHERPLNRRGRRAAGALGSWLKSSNYIPDQILSSTSARTKETCALLGFDSPKNFLDSLYLAGPGRMLEELRKASGSVVLMLGHNPGIAFFAGDLVAATPDHPRFSDFPTCATLVVDFQIDDWADLKPGTGQLKAFVIPKELTD